MPVQTRFHLRMEGCSAAASPRRRGADHDRAPCTAKRALPLGGSASFFGAAIGRVGRAYRRVPVQSRLPRAKMSVAVQVSPEESQKAKSRPSPDCRPAVYRVIAAGLAGPPRFTGMTGRGKTGHARQLTRTN